MPAVLPESPSILGHIFRARKGHLSDDTPENRALLVAVANDSAAESRRDPYGNWWFYRQQRDGTEVWVQVYNGLILNGGVNLKPTRERVVRRV